LNGGGIPKQAQSECGCNTDRRIGLIETPDQERSGPQVANPTCSDGSDALDD
jgi:hypothetical protein